MFGHFVCLRYSRLCDAELWHSGVTSSTCQYANSQKCWCLAVHFNEVHHLSLACLHAKPKYWIRGADDGVDDRLRVIRVGGVNSLQTMSACNTRDRHPSLSFRVFCCCLDKMQDWQIDRSTLLLTEAHNHPLPRPVTSLRCCLTVTSQGALEYISEDLIHLS